MRSAAHRGSHRARRAAAGIETSVRLCSDLEGTRSPHLPGRTAPMHIDLSGKVAIVTGGGRGIGREIAVTLAAEGVTTVVTDVRQEYLDAVAGEFAERGWVGRQYLCDVREAAGIAE